MKNNELTTAYVFDAEGWFNGITAWQWKNGAYLETPDATLKSPWGDGRPSPDVFYRYDAKTGEWSEHQKPHCAADLEGVWISNESLTAHDVEMRELIKEFGKEEGFRIERNNRNDWCVMRVPKPSPEDLEAAKIEQEMAELEAKVAALSYRMTIAMMQNDTEETKQIQMEYAELTEGANHEEVL